MNRVVFLDTGVLGFLTNPNANATTQGCVRWLRNLLATGARVCVAEVCDYELRREYVRRGATAQIGKLDALNSSLNYVPINTPAMRKAADLWAQARNRGRATADEKALDSDVILSAQAQLTARPGDQLVVATTDVGDLSTYGPAEQWTNVSP